MLVYYGRRGIKEYLPTTSSPGKNPVGVLALICTAVQTPKLSSCPLVLIPWFLQVERGLFMHSTGYYIKNESSFSERFWGNRTAIYVKLAKALSDSQWNSFYGGLSYTEGYHEKQSEFSRPVEHWTDNPDEYFIMGSDPANTE
jgi:hypothetical protein